MMSDNEVYVRKIIMNLCKPNEIKYMLYMFSIGGIDITTAKVLDMTGMSQTGYWLARKSLTKRKWIKYIDTYTVAINYSQIFKDGAAAGILNPLDEQE